MNRKTTQNTIDSKTYDYFTLLIERRDQGIPLNLPKPYQLKQNLMLRPLERLAK